MTVTLILGGARSGKSARAQALAEDQAKDGKTALIFIATSEPLDKEMRDRIDRHKADRGPAWRTLETPVALAEVILRESRPGSILLVDCLTLWLSNLMHYEHNVQIEIDRLIDALGQVRGTVILVSNELGLGLVPETSLGRRFRDAQGRLNQMMAAQADGVEFIVAGLVQKLKPNEGLHPIGQKPRKRLEDRYEGNADCL